MTALAIFMAAVTVGTIWGVRRSRHIDSHISAFLREENKRGD